MTIPIQSANPPAVDAPASAIPACRHFGACGGCQLQDAAYPAQLSLKAGQLRSLLAPHHLTLPELRVHASPPYEYRNRIRLTLALVEGQLRTGYLGNAASQLEGRTSFVPIRECPVAAPVLWRSAEAFLELVNADSDPWLRTPQLVPDQLEIFASADESRLNLTLYLRTSAKALPATLAPAFGYLCEALQAQIPELTGAGIALLPAASPQRSRRSETTRPGPTWGARGLNYSIPDGERITENGQLSYWVPRTAFFQINRFLLPELLGLVSRQANISPDPQLAWDLYAGVGLFSKALAANFGQVIAVEIAEQAFAALAATKLPNLVAVQATTLDFLRAAVVQRERPGLIVLDPPRTGAGPEVCALLARIAAPTLVYVSCSPQTLPADLAILTGSGYAVAELHLFDLFPQTTHIETVAILTR